MKGELIRLPSVQRTPSYGDWFVYGWLHLVVEHYNNEDGTTSIDFSLNHIGRPHTSDSECDVHGTISATVGGVTKRLNLPQQFHLTDDASNETIYSETLTFERTEKNENARIDVSNSGGRFYADRYTVLYGGQYWGAAWEEGGKDDTENVSSQYEVALDEIEINSAFVSYSASVETTQTFSAVINQRSPEFRHRIRFLYGEQEVYAEGNITNPEYSLAVPRSWMAYNTYAESFTVDVELSTYSGDSQIGRAAVVPLLLKADAGMRPKLNDGAYTVTAVGTENIVGYVRGVTKLMVSFDDSKIDLYDTAGATIETMGVVHDGIFYEGNPAVSAAVQSGRAVVRVTDTRGRSADAEVIFDLIEYTEPSITVNRAFKSDADGNESEDGGYITVLASAAIASVAGQNSVVSFAGDIEGRIYPLQQNNPTVIGGGLVDADNAYRLIVSVTDLVGKTKSYTVKIPGRKWLMRGRPTGNGIAFGKSADTDGVFEIAGDWTFKIGEVELTAEDFRKIKGLIQ